MNKNSNKWYISLRKLNLKNFDNKYYTAIAGRVSIGQFYPILSIKKTFIYYSS